MCLFWTGQYTIKDNIVWIFYIVFRIPWAKHICIDRYEAKKWKSWGQRIPSEKEASLSRSAFGNHKSHFALSQTCSYEPWSECHTSSVKVLIKSLLVFFCNFRILLPKRFILRLVQLLEIGLLFNNFPETFGPFQYFPLLFISSPLKRISV